MKIRTNIQAVFAAFLGTAILVSTLHAQTPEPISPEQGTEVVDGVIIPEAPTFPEGEAILDIPEEATFPEGEAVEELHEEYSEGDAVVAQNAPNQLFLPMMAAPVQGGSGAPSVTAADTIFLDGFDGGNLAAWSSSFTDSGDLSATQAAKLIGTYGLQAQIDDNTAIYVTDERPDREARYRVRFHLDPNSIRMASGDAFFIFLGYSKSTPVVGIELSFKNGGYILRGAIRSDNNAWKYTSAFGLTDKPHFVEFDWRSAASSSNKNGYFKLWVDNSLRSSISNMDNDTHRIDRAHLGAVANVDSGTRGTIYLDAFESRETSYMGPATNEVVVPPTVTPTPTQSPSETPTPTPMPTTTPGVPITGSGDDLNRRHPDAGIWVVYRGSQTTAELQQPHIRGIMAYVRWATLWPQTNSYNWWTLRNELDYIINVVGKDALVNMTAGYCTHSPWPEPMRAVTAERKTVSTQGCKPLQFWDPQYLSMYRTFIRDFAEEMARFDSTDSRPNETNITIVRAAEMAETMENLPNDSDLANWEWTDFNPAPNGRIYQVNLTKELKWQYYQAVLATYEEELKRAYDAVGLPVPPMAGARNVSTYWGPTPVRDWVFEHNMLINTHGSAPAPQGEYDDMYVGTQSLKTRAAVEAYAFPGSIASWLGQFSYWEVLSNLHFGVEFMGTYGNNKNHATIQPKGPLSWAPNLEPLLLGDKYAGEMRNPATSPGVLIAFRGGYFEDNYSQVFMRRWIGNYEHGIIQTNLQNSVALYGLSHTEGAGQVNPPIRRAEAPNWASEYTLCRKKYSERECAPALQPPDLSIGDSGSYKQYAYKTTDLGTVRWCNTDMFCVDGTATRTEKMPWARRTNGQPIILDVNDAFANSLGGSVQVRVVYLDQGTGQWSLIADGQNVLTIRKTGSNIWREAFVTVSPGALNLSLDPMGDGDDIFHLVEVTRQ